jgi:pimeloyl-ACP methyl ester carboxylesterase
MTKNRYAAVDRLKIFYREAGPKTAPPILLLHGFPTSSHMFRDLIPELASDHLVPSIRSSRSISVPSGRPFSRRGERTIHFS